MTRRHPRAGLRRAWVLHVAASPVGNSCKLMLLAMATEMGDHATLTGWRRADIARLAGIMPARVAERIAEARRHRLLDQVGLPAPGRPASYQAILGGHRVATLGLALPARATEPAWLRGWAERVITADVGTACKVLLLVTGFYADTKGVVAGLTRAQLAQLLGVSPSRVRDRFREARAGGLLEIKDGGRCHRPVRYQLLLEAPTDTAERYPAAPTNTGERYRETGTQHPVALRRRDRLGGTLYARASSDATSHATWRRHPVRRRDRVVKVRADEGGCAIVSVAVAPLRARVWCARWTDLTARPA